MSRPLSVLIGLSLVLLVAISTAAADSKQARVVRIDQPDVKVLRAGTSSLSAVDTCIVRHDEGIAWKIDGWVIGNELYKNYLDPSLSCPDPYPFVVTEIVMSMYFAAATPLYVAVDIETVDLTDPSCPAPGVLVAISSDYEVQIPSEGLWDIWVQLDEPFEVTGPFFAGFFIGNTLDASVGAAVITDDDPTALCRSYNIWDETYGFVDLLDSAYWNNLWAFPGRLVLYASGYPAGTPTPTEPVPVVSWVYPNVDNQRLLGTGNLWANETSGSTIVDYVSFSYSTGGAFTEIGRDYDGASPLRDGINNSGTGSGFSSSWNFSALSEGSYTLRAIAHDTLGRTAYDDITVYIEPTPPVPTIVSPDNGTDICTPLSILVSCQDENMWRMNFLRKTADDNYSANLTAVSQFKYGDVNGLPYDGNTLANSEFGAYYSAPVVAAQAVKLWYDRGYTTLMTDGSTPVSFDTLVERMAVRFKTRTDKGTYDESVVQGLTQFSSDKGGLLTIYCLRNPDYFAVRRFAEEEEKAVLLALGGTPGVWLIMDGFSGWTQDDGSYLVTVCNPITGTKVTVPMRNNSGINELNLNGTWQRVDMLVSAGVASYAITRTSIGSDVDGSNGWSLSWDPTGLVSGLQYFIRVEALDFTSITDASVVTLNYDCASFYQAGDYNGDGKTNLVDLNYLTQYLTNHGPAPVGGAWRGDANCDTRLNITDIVYYLNFLFGLTAVPCH